MKWKVTAEESGLTLDEWLHQRLPQASAGYLGQLLRSGRVRRDNESLSRDARVVGDEWIELPASQRLQQLLAKAGGCRILRQTDHWAIVYKPAGLAVHRSPQQLDNLTDRLQQLYLREKAPFKVAPVHRLDIGTSGPVLFGKGRQATGELGRMVMERGMRKRYLVLAAGQLDRTGTLASPLEIDGKLKTAVTSYRCLQRWSDCCLLLVDLQTGRKHQIRRHLAEIGHAVAGDQRYRSQITSPTGRIFLHQCLIGFTDPWQQAEIKLTIPLPADLRHWLNILGTNQTTLRS
jgi:23S rRNA pseudouridine955/2504/2580 synthase